VLCLCLCLCVVKPTNSSWRNANGGSKLQKKMMVVRMATWKRRKEWLQQGQVPVVTMLMSVPKVLTRPSLDVTMARLMLLL